jgi:serine protease Do
LDSLNVALQLHRDFDRVRAQLIAKTGPAAPVARPEEFPELKEKYGSSLDYAGKVVESCIHCHQVGEQLLAWYRKQGGPLPPEVVLPYPHPKVIGLQMDPAHARKVKSVTPNSPAAEAGLKADDEILECENQPIISTADIQWVLHRLGDKRQVALQVQRGDQSHALSITLPEGWREQGDIAWRVSSWTLRRLLTGGLKLDEMTSEELESLKLQSSAVGLRIKHVGQFHPHDAAKRAGFKVGDVLLSVGQWQERMNESQLLLALLREAKRGEPLPVELLRGDKRLTLQLPVQP